MMNAIVLDGEQRSALAVTRSLGRKGVTVAVGSENIPCLSSCSRYCTQSFSYPSPYKDPSGFIKALLNFTISFPEAVLFPITDISLTEILVNRSLMPDHLLIPFESYDNYMKVTDKINLFRIARDLNIPVPTTLLSTDYGNLETMIQGVISLGFPVVVKTSISKIRTGTGWINGRVQYATSENNLRKVLSEEIYRKFPFLVQKKITGPGIGIFLLMKNGEVIAKFAHKRIREKPPSGGVSVLSESIKPPVGAANDAIRLLKNIGWTGVAMVEFKVDLEEKNAKLLEVNARFWGSLQLSIFSGIDFPYMLYRMSQGELIGNVNNYKVGLKCRWELGDFDHVLIRIFKNPLNENIPSSQPNILKLLLNCFMDNFSTSVKNEVLQSNDVRPFLHELKIYIQHIFR